MFCDLNCRGAFFSFLFLAECVKTHFFAPFSPQPFNLRQMRLATKYRFFCPKWLTEICTFIIKCDTKLAGALSSMEGLTETGAPNPFICVGPRKREEWCRGGLGLQNVVARGSPEARPPQPSKHESPVLCGPSSPAHMQSLASQRYVYRQ